MNHCIPGGVGVKSTRNPINISNAKQIKFNSDSINHQMEQTIVLGAVPPVKHYQNRNNDSYNLNQNKPIKHIPCQEDAV